MARRPRSRKVTEEAEVLAVALGVARVAWGGMQVLAPGVVDLVLVRPATPRPRTILRMKGVRDLAFGIGALSAGSPAALANWTRLGALVDAGDAAATVLDRGRELRRPVTVLGALVGFGTLVIAAAASNGLVGRRRTR